MKISKVLKRTNPARVIGFIILALYSVTMAYALFWALTASLNEHVPLILDGLALPKKLHFENYLEAFTVLETSNASFLEMLWNSLWLTVTNSCISLAAMVLVAYPLARFEFRGRKFILAVMYFVMLIPIFGSGAAVLRMYIRLGMYDSPLIVIKSASALGMMTLIIKTFFENIPGAYEETARIDGASRLRIFLQIHIPLVKSSLFAIFIMAFIGGWNDYSLPIYYLPSYPTISSGLFVYETVAKFNMNKPVFFAGVIMCAIPPMVLFGLFGDKLLTTVSFGGIKG